MRCDEARPMISAGLDGELEGIGAAQLEAHFAGCGPCSTEREAVRATVRMLRALPEAEPPAELRRRIGVALLDVERASQGRRLGLAWLARPQAAGWAWGAALGAIVAAVALVATRPHSPTAPLVAVPRPLPAIAPAPPGVDHNSSVQTIARKPGSSRPTSAVMSPRRVIVPTVTAEVLTAKQPPLLPLPLVDPVTQPRAPRKASSHPEARRLRRVRPPASVPSSHCLVAQASPGTGNAAPNRPERATNDPPQLARTQPASPGDPPTPAPSDSAMQDTSGMTQMASGAGMPASSEKEADDLVELRHRLTDRPLQVPDLGEVKPANSPRSGKDGWIRF